MHTTDFKLADRIRFTEDFVIDSTATINKGDTARVVSISDTSDVIWVIMDRPTFKLPMVRLDFTSGHFPKFERIGGK